MKTTLGMLGSMEPKQLWIPDIAKAAEVSQVTIYNYFGSKEALLKETFKDFIQQVACEFEEALNSRQSLKEIIEYTLFKEKQTCYTLPPALVKELLIDDYVEEQYEQVVISLMVRMVDEAKARGEISDKVSTARVAWKRKGQ